VTVFTIKGNSVLQTSALKIVLEYAYSFKQYSTRNRYPMAQFSYEHVLSRCCYGLLNLVPDESCI